MAAILLARVTFPLWPPRRAVHPRTDARPRRSLLWAGDGRTDNLRYRRRRRASRNLFGYSQNASQTSGVVSAASHIGRLTRRCHRSNRSFRRESGMFQRKKGGKEKGKTPAGKEKQASNGGACIEGVFGIPRVLAVGPRRWRKYRTWIRQMCSWHVLRGVRFELDPSINVFHCSVAVFRLLDNVLDVFSTLMNNVMVTNSWSLT